MRGKRGISPLIATIILIAIALAGGLLVYTYMTSMAGVLSAKGQVSVEAIDLVRGSDGKATFSITVKNSGNKPIKQLNVTLASESEASFLGISAANPLQPGQTASYIKSSGFTGTYTAGNSYNVVIEAVFTDGSTFTTTVSVKCRSA